MDVSAILSTLAVMGLRTLRENIVLAALANREYEERLQSRPQFATVNITVPAAVASQAVTAANVPPTTTDQAPTVVPIQLTEWREAPFTLSDFDLQKIDAGIIPMQAAEAVKTICNDIENFLWTKANFYGFAGLSGVTPFAVDDSEYRQARKIGNVQLMPPTPRYVILDPEADANAIGLKAFQDASAAGDTSVIRNGVIGTKLGATWAMSQLVPSQGNGSATGYLVNNGAGYGVGIKTIAVDTGSGVPPAGSVFTFANHTQTYVVDAVVGAGPITAITFAPGLVASVPDNNAITFKAAFRKNVLIHRDAIGFAMSPLSDTKISEKLVDMQSIIDPESGLALRVELTREHKRWRWSFDALYGATRIRPELGVLIPG